MKHIKVQSNRTWGGLKLCSWDVQQTEEVRVHLPRKQYCDLALSTGAIDRTLQGEKNWKEKKKREDIY